MVSMWYYVPPPYDQKDAIPLQAPPIGARFTDSASPKATVQIIGEAGSIVPRVVTKDLGFVDLRIINGKEIRFVGKGLETDVGTRDPSPTTGMSMEAGSRRVVAASPAGITVPNGSLVWATSEKVGRGVSRVQRVRWYYISPENGYSGEPIPLDGAPYGVSDPKATDPSSSLQIVGRSRTALPSTDVDLGFADVKIVSGNVARVTPKETASVEEAPKEEATLEPIDETPTEPTGDILELESEKHTIRPVSSVKAIRTKSMGKSRPDFSSKKPKRTWLEEVATLKGFNAYTSQSN